MSTLFPSKNNMQRSWYVLDAQDVVLGRLATKVAMMLMGKHKPTYTPFIDTGDHVVVVNADKVRLTGNKEEDKNLLSSLRLSGWLENNYRRRRCGRRARSG